MAIKPKQTMVLLAAFFALELGAYAQQPAEGGQGSARQPAADHSSGKQSAASNLSDSDDALEVPVLEQLDEQHVTYMESHIDLKYNYDQFEGDSSLNRIGVHWLQAFGPSERLAAGIEVPFLKVQGEGMEPNASGIGDIEVELRGMLTKGEKFEQAAGIVLALPSAKRGSRL